MVEKELLHGYFYDRKSVEKYSDDFRTISHVLKNGHPLCRAKIKPRYSEFIPCSVLFIECEKCKAALAKKEDENKPLEQEEKK